MINGLSSIHIWFFEKKMKKNEKKMKMKNKINDKWTFKYSYLVLRKKNEKNEKKTKKNRLKFSSSFFLFLSLRFA